jgi:DNA polymerase
MLRRYLNKANVMTKTRDTVYIDFETKSACDLKACGSDVYARHSTTEVLCLGYAFNDEPVQMWKFGDPAPFDLLFAIEEGCDVVGHNIGGFEVPVWFHVCHLKYGWPKLKIEQCYDTMIYAYAMGIPGSLDKSSSAVGLSHTKDLAGGRVMLQLSQPRTKSPLTWYERSEYPDKFRKMYDYCAVDVEVERALYKTLKPISTKERALWIVDHYINQRGIKVDVEKAKAALEIVTFEQKRLRSELQQVTANGVSTYNAHQQFKEWLKTRRIEADSIDKAAVTNLLRSDIPNDVRRALEIRQEAAKSSTAKYEAMINGACDDGRVRNCFQFTAAHTRRWAGRRLQLQNFPRPTMKHEQIEKVVEQLGKPHARDYMEIVYGSPMTVLSDCLRSMIIAKDGCELMCADFSAIEARGLAWLSGQESILEIFRGNGKIYEHAASGIYRIPIADVNKAQRQIGKVAVLALGYGGGKGAFQQMAKGYGVVVSDEEAEEIKNKWRAANPQIVKYWYALEEAAISAVEFPGTQSEAGPKGREVKFVVEGSFLWCLLPSGGILCYPYPNIEEIETPWGSKKMGLTYMTENSVTRVWERAKHYGGSLSENITQSLCRDILAEAIMRFEERGFPVVMHAHDEIVCEVETGKTSLQEFEKIMSEVPSWAKGFPIDAEGWQGKRYRK